jgi:hypothetical protein
MSDISTFAPLQSNDLLIPGLSTNLDTGAPVDLYLVDEGDEVQTGVADGSSTAGLLVLAVLGIVGVSRVVSRCRPLPVTAQIRSAS